MRLGFILLLAGVQLLVADSFVFGAGGGSSAYFGGLSIDSSYVTQAMWRIEAEVGYYTGREGLDILLVYADNLTKPRNTSVLTRDQHAALLGEYRLFLLSGDGSLQGALGFGPSLRRFHSYSDEDVTHLPIRFHLDLGAGILFFATRHILVRGQACYSFPALRPLEPGVVSLSLRFGFRS